MAGIDLVEDRGRLTKSTSSQDVTTGSPVLEPLTRSAGFGRAEQRQLTLMFADLVGSTQLSERLDLEDYYAVIADYLECCDAIVREHQGFIAQHQGDCVLAYFGFPAAAEDDAERAAAAGLAIVDAVARLKPLRERALQTRVGIATGVVLVSDLSSERRHAQRSVMGETPNLAARLQAQAAPGTVVINQTTRDLLGRAFVCKDLGTRPLKGFSEPVRLWQVCGLRPSTARFEDRQRGTPTPLVGRDREVALLLRRWRQAKHGSGQVVLVAGEPGIGKSRLTRILCNRIGRERHARVLYQCSLNRAASSLHPVIVQLGFAAGFVSSDSAPQKLDKLERMVAPLTDDLPATARLLARLLSIPAETRYGPLDLAPGQIKDATLEHLVGMIQRLAARTPVVLLFEDLHWSDPTTHELLELVISRIGQLRVLLIGTARPEYAAPWAAGPQVTTLNLPRLNAPQSAVLIENVSSGRRLPTELIEQVVAKTDGVPLFIEELTKSLLESGSLRLEQGVYTVAGRPDALSLPSTLQGSLLTRLDRLPGARDLASVGAAIGRTFSYQLLQAVTELAGGALHPILDRLIDAQLLFRWGVGAQAFFSFKHALIQDAAYSTLLKSQRRVLHAKIAATLRAGFPEIVTGQPEVLAHHYALAGDAADALEFRRRAAAVAIQSSANAEAIAHIHAALEQNERLDSAGQRLVNEIALRQMMGVPLEARSWGSGEIETNLLRLHKLIKRTGDQPALLSVLHGLCGVHILGGRLAVARKFARKMSRAARQSHEPVFSLLSERSLGMCDFFAGELAAAIVHFDQVIALCGENVRDQAKTHYVADPDLVAHCMSAWAHVLLGKRAAAARHVEAALAITHAREHIFSRIYAFGVLASYHQAAEDYAGALRYATLAITVSQQNNNRYWEAWAQIVKGWARVAAGEHRAGLAELRDGVDKYAATGSRLILPYASALLADACGRAGEVDEARRVLGELDQAHGANEVRFIRDLLARTTRRLSSRVGQRAS